MFEVAADAYDRLMGLYSVQLAPQFADFAGIDSGRRVLDVGAGPGALTAELVARLGTDGVVAVDPSETFVTANRERHPGVDVRRAGAEDLPFPDGSFDAALAQLVVHFMSDPVAGLREMRRVTRDGGVVTACVWDHAGDRSPLTPFWQAARELAEDVQDESQLAGARAGHLSELSEAAGLRDVEETELAASVTYESFEEWWQPFTEGVGPVGAYVQRLDEAQREELREHCRALVGNPPFTIHSVAWATRGVR